MKETKLIFMAVLVFVILGMNGWCQESGSSQDNFGKIIGRIFDEETNLPVSEVFKVLLADCSNTSNPQSANMKFVKSSSRGVFVFNNVKPGIYCVVFFPLAGKTIYCYEPAPNLSPEFRHIVKIIPGQITRINLKARRGGNLKVILVDKNGNTISPRSIMPPSPYPDFPNDELRRMHIQLYSLENNSNSVSYNTFSDDYLDDGEITLSGLFPGKYKFDVKLSYLGYGWPITLTSIDVLKGQTLEIKVLVDFMDNTGIEGTITDQYGLPIKGAFVSVGISGDDDSYSYGSIRTNQNGYYKIVGLKEGLYNLDVLIMWNPENNIIDSESFRNIRVIKNTITKKDIILKKPIL